MKAHTSESASNWRLSAACAGTTDTAIFFSAGPDKADNAASHQQVQASAAKEICFICDVRMECLEYAVETRQPFGIWGGLLPNERRPLTRGTPTIRWDVPGEQHGLEGSYRDIGCKCLDCVSAHFDGIYRSITEGLGG